MITKWQIYIFQTIGQISTTRHKPAMGKWDSICSNEGPRPLARVDNNEIAQIH